MFRLKNRSLEGVALLAVLIIIIVLGSLKDTLSGVAISNNLDPAKQYLDSHTFQDISMVQLYNEIFNHKLSETDQKMELEDLQIGLGNDYKVRVMNMNITDTSDSELKSYVIQYNRETNYFNVRESKGTNNERSQSAISVLTEFDKYKNSIIFPVGNYSYYAVNLYLSGSIGPGDNLYLINDQGIQRISDKTIDGFIFMVYGEPIEKEDHPIFYAMPY